LLLEPALRLALANPQYRPQLQFPIDAQLVGTGVPGAEQRMNQ
jgi:hypothetical protein